MKAQIAAYLGCLILACGSFAQADVKVNNLELKGADEASRKAYMAQPVRLWGTGQYSTDPQQRVNLISLSNSKTAFILKLDGKVNDKNELTASLGMMSPSVANWYANGFFNFDVGGMTEKNTSVKIADIKSSPELGSVALLYTGPDFKAELTVSLAENDDKLMIEFKPEHKSSQARHYRVGLLCYPSSLGGGYQAGLKVRQREGMIPSGTLPCKDNFATLNPLAPWVLFYDRHFDVKNNRGEGPCAVLFNSKDAARQDLLIGNYSCEMNIWYPMERTAQFILWDFHNWSNESAQNYMKELEIEQ